MAYKDEIPAFVSLDIDFFEDTEIKRLRRKVGTDGIIVYLYVAMQCYKENGYYCEENDDLYEDMEEKFGLKPNRTRQIMKYLIQKSLFVRKPLDGVNVITSATIQRRWMDAVKGRIAKRVSRGEHPFKLNESVWIIKNRYPKYFYLSQPFLDKSETKSSLSETKNSMSETKCSLSRQEKSREEKNRIEKSRSSREELINEYGKECVQYYEARTCDYYNTSTIDYKKVIQFLTRDKKNQSGFFRTYRSQKKDIHNFKERQYDFDQMEMEHIKRINS